MDFAASAKRHRDTRRAPAVTALPSPAKLAIFLDLDGTLLDIARAPGAVVVPSSLPDLLARLSDRVGGAFAIVSGRTIDSLAALLSPLCLTLAGEHGAVLKRAGKAEEELVRASVPAEWHRALTDLVARTAGLLLEEKPHGVTLHYRGAPHAAQGVERALRALIAGYEDTFAVRPARMAWEIRPRDATKGTAVLALLEREPFAGRTPLFIGDDATDQDGIAAARFRGGMGFEVGPSFGDAAGVRAWLAKLLEGREWARRGA